jgi:hypothetical protein
MKAVNNWKQVQATMTKGATQHKGIVKGSILGMKRAIGGGYYEIGGQLEGGKFVRATGETREDAVKNWNAKKWQ